MDTGAIAECGAKFDGVWQQRLALEKLQQSHSAGLEQARCDARGPTNAPESISNPAQARV